jgi:hypothetical protein
MKLEPLSADEIIKQNKADGKAKTSAYVEGRNDNTSNSGPNVSKRGIHTCTSTNLVKPNKSPFNKYVYKNLEILSMIFLSLL